MWNKKEISRLDATLTRVHLTLTFGLEFTMSNCISAMGCSIVIEEMAEDTVRDRGDLRCWHFLLLVQLPVGRAPTMHGFSPMTSRQSGSPIGGEDYSQTTHGSIVEERPVTTEIVAAQYRSSRDTVLSTTIKPNNHESAIFVWQLSLHV